VEMCIFGALRICKSFAVHGIYIMRVAERIYWQLEPALTTNWEPHYGHPCSDMHYNLRNLGVIDRVILKWLLRKRCSRMRLSTLTSGELQQSW
jgi:hypothetical protein